jgi:hypothetical protein
MLKIAATNGNTQLNALASADTLAIYDLSLTAESPPAHCADPPTGTLLTTFPLASPWAGSASGGQRALNGLPIPSAAIALTGTPAYFRLTSSGTTTMQGTIGRTGTLDPNGKPWDLTTDGTRFAAGTIVNLVDLTFIAFNNDV